MNKKPFEDSLYDEPLPGSFMAKFTKKQQEAINAMTNKAIVEASRKSDDDPPATMGPCKEVEIGEIDQASVIRLEYELELARLRDALGEIVGDPNDFTTTGEGHARCKAIALEALKPTTPTS